jgi:multiple sugar transport system permease protein
MMNKTARFRSGNKGYIYSLPLLILTAVFIVIPVAGTMISSLYRDVTFLPLEFLGWGNYTRLFSDPNFLQSLQFTLLFTITSVSLEFVLGMTFALILNEKLPARYIFRTALLIPWAIPIAISSRVWELLYNYEYGVLNFIALQLGGEAVNWLGTPTGAFFSIVLGDVWKTTPFMSIIFLAGLSMINNELYEQAGIDGANIFQRFFKITLPLLKPVIIVALLFRTIDAVRILDIIYVLTGGGPGGSTTSVSLYAYNYYVSGDFGYGSAVSVIVFLIASALAVLYVKFIKIGDSSI